MKLISLNLATFKSKVFFISTLFVAFSLFSFSLPAQTNKADASPQYRGEKQLFMDIHRLEPGKVTYDAVAGAHAKDLAVQGKYDVQFKKFWVDEKGGLIYCLSSSNDSVSIRKVHAEAHGLQPDQTYVVTGGTEAALKGGKSLFMDIHYLGAGKVSAKDVAAAHQKDLAVQHKHGVNFVNYWVNEKEGVVFCLSESTDSTSVIRAHKEAHGLVPEKIAKVKQGE